MKLSRKHQKLRFDFCLNPVMPAITAVYFMCVEYENIYKVIWYISGDTIFNYCRKFSIQLLTQLIHNFSTVIRTYLLLLPELQFLHALK